MSKELVATEIVKRFVTGQTIGVGTGTTVDVALEQLAARIAAEKLNVRLVPSSYETARRCEGMGLTVLHPRFGGVIDWGFDGADAVNDQLWLIKGRGGALLQEKILAAKCKKFIVIVDESKIVTSFVGLPIPIEVIPEALDLVQWRLKDLGAVEMTVRTGNGKHGPVVTEAGNLLIDASFNKSPETLEHDIKSLTGVVDSGLFIGYASEVLVGGLAGIRSLKKS